MRPQSIIWFERLILASVIIGLIYGIFSYNNMVAQLETNPVAAEAGLGSRFVIAIMLTSLGIPLLLWYFIARRASNIAKWILVILTGIGLLMLPNTLANQPTSTFAGTLMINVLQTALQLAAIVMLFRRDAREWLAPEPTKRSELRKPGVRIK